MRYDCDALWRGIRGKTLFQWLFRFIKHVYYKFYFEIKRHFIKPTKYYENVIINLAGGLGDMVLFEPWAKLFDMKGTLFITYPHTAQYLKQSITQADFLQLHRQDPISDIKRLAIACENVYVPKDEVEAHLAATLIKAHMKYGMVLGWPNPIWNKRVRFIWDRNSLQRSIFGIKSATLNIYKTKFFLALYYYIFFRLTYDEITISLHKHYLDSFREFFGKDADFYIMRRNKKKNYILVNIFASEEYRNIPTSWIYTLAKRYPHINFYLIGRGTIDEKNILQLPNIKNYINQTDFVDLFTLYESACAYIGADTFTAHLAIRYRIPSFVVLNNAPAYPIFYAYKKPHMLFLYFLFPKYDIEHEFDCNRYPIQHDKMEDFLQKVHDFIEKVVKQCQS